MNDDYYTTVCLLPNSIASLKASPDNRGLERSDDSDDPNEIEQLKSSKGKALKTLIKRPRSGRETSNELTIRSATDGGQTTLVESDCSCDKCKLGEDELCEAWEDELPGRQVIMDIDDGDLETMAFMLALDKIEPDIIHGDDPETDFMQHLDRERAKVFKKCW